MSWVEIGKLTDIPRLGARIVRTKQGDVAVFRTGDDQVFALKDECPHKGGPLSQGIVHDHRVTCPLHNWVIALEDGQAQGPDEGCSHVYKIKFEDDSILLELSDDNILVGDFSQVAEA